MSKFCTKLSGYIVAEYLTEYCILYLVWEKFVQFLDLLI